MLSTIDQEPAELPWISVEHLESRKVILGLGKGKSLPVGLSRRKPSDCWEKIWWLNVLTAEEGVYPCQSKGLPGGLGLVVPYRPEAWIFSWKQGYPCWSKAVALRLGEGGTSRG